MSDLNRIIRSRIANRGATTHVREQRVQRPRGLVREYKCSSLGHAKRFVSALMELQEHTYHNTRLHVDGCKVVLETYTTGVDAVTELDHEYVEEADDLFTDAR